MQSRKPVTYSCPPSCGYSPGIVTLKANPTGSLLCPYLLLVRNVTDKEMEMSQSGVSCPRSIGGKRQSPDLNDYQVPETLVQRSICVCRRKVYQWITTCVWRMRVNLCRNSHWGGDTEHGLGRRPGPAWDHGACGPPSKLEWGPQDDQVGPRLSRVPPKTHVLRGLPEPEAAPSL